jgi:tRNA nucleotidyltransferase/poly(A) polymerase
MLNTSLIPQSILGFLDELNRDGKVWLVGGCVRDVLLGRTPKDWDLVTTTPGVFEDRWPQIGKQFPVFQTHVDGHTVEIAAARTEKKIGLGHTGFEVQATGNLMEDLMRRDLTINAIAWNRDGLVHPPTSLEDLNDHILRAVSDAFREDPLRVFRVARFSAQLGFKVYHETRWLMASMEHELSSLPADRVRGELEKALLAPYPMCFFYALGESDSLRQWFKEIQLIGWHEPPFGQPKSLDEGYFRLGRMFHENDVKGFCNQMGLGSSTMRLMQSYPHRYPVTPTEMINWLLRVQRTSLGIGRSLEVMKPRWSWEQYGAAQYVWGRMRSVDFSTVPDMDKTKMMHAYRDAIGYE